MNAASVRPTCQGTILGSCVDARDAAEHLTDGGGSDD